MSSRRGSGHGWAMPRLSAIHSFAFSNFPSFDNSALPTRKAPECGQLLDPTIHLPASQLLWLAPFFRQPAAHGTKPRRRSGAKRCSQRCHLIQRCSEQCTFRSGCWGWLLHTQCQSPISCITIARAARTADASDPVAIINVVVR